MKILHIETSSRNCSVAISHDSEILCLCEEVSENYKQSESLHTFVQWALEGAGITLQELNAVCLGKGPGSYTGLRIGASSAKGFCFGLGIPLLAVSSMDTMVEGFLGQDYDYIIPLIDARRMEVYTATYSADTGEVISPADNLILDEQSFQDYADKKLFFVGDGCTKAQEILALPMATFLPSVYPSAEHLVRKARERFLGKNFEDVAYFEPFYLKDFHGVKKAKQPTQAPPEP